MSLVAGVFLSLLVTGVAYQQTPGSQSPEAQLVAIDVAGTTRMTREDVAKLSGLAVGTPVQVATLQSAAERLARSGLFESVEYRYTTMAGKLTVTFDVVEAERNVPVIFDNFVWFSDAQLLGAVREALPSFDGRVPQNEDVPDHITRALQAILDSRKIPGSVGFMPQTAVGSDSLQFIFKVADPSPRICKVGFEGVSPGPLRELASNVAPLVGQDYSRFYVSSMTAATLTDTYRHLGYWRASFESPTTTLDDSCDGVSLQLSVDEGPSYVWQMAEWKGNVALDANALDKLLGMRSGDLADLVKIKSGLRQVAKAYGRNGYVQAQTSLTPRLNDEQRRAVFEIHVTEGRQFRMGALEVLGFSERDGETLSKRWRLKPGDIFDASHADEFSAKELAPLRRTGKPAELQYHVDPSAGVVNVRIVLQR